jgi:hypothetical protein
MLLSSKPMAMSVSVTMSVRGARSLSMLRRSAASPLPVTRLLSSFSSSAPAPGTTSTPPRKYPSNKEIERSLGYVNPLDLPPNDDPVEMRDTAGLRMWRLARQEKGNLLTPAVRGILRRRMELMESDANYAAQTGLFYAMTYERNPYNEKDDVFCKGIDHVAYSKDKMGYLLNLHRLVNKIYHFNPKKNLIAVYAGLVNGTGFAGT